MNARFERFVTARKIAEHLYRPQQDFAGSVQAFLKLLVRWTGTLVAILQAAFRRRMQEALAAEWMVQGWALFGVDGSRVDLPRTQSHEAAYSLARNRAGKKLKRTAAALHRKAHQKANTPQMADAAVPRRHRSALVVADWSDRQQRAGHCRDVARTSREGPPAADAGFVGYDYIQVGNRQWSDLHRASAERACKLVDQGN
jgi:hypothetical protein